MSLGFFSDNGHRHQFQTQFTDERLDILPVLHGDVLKYTLIYSFLLPAHGALLLPIISTGCGNGTAAPPARQAELPWPPVPEALTQIAGLLP